MRGVEHIERTIDVDVSLAEVAAEAALSEYHFHRVFRSRFGLPVMDYVRRRRLTKAADALLRTRMPIIGIALDAGFQSQAAFTRAFRKVYHTTPARFRARGRDVPWLSSASISAAALAMLPGLGKDQPRLEAIDGFEIEGITATLNGAGRAGIPQLWRRLADAVGHARFAGADRMGISHGDDAVLGGVLSYMAGLRAESYERSDDRLERCVVAGGAYLVFRFEGEISQVSSAYDLIFGTWMPGSRHALRAGPSFTRSLALDESGARAAMEIWIPVRAS